ncbi:2OG-Fe(II) oxygenase [Gloeobacter kilaueensis]|uniref:2OG-Fe(II) oxygenase n=1 Tax=Gloeobacter kilaueensis (strain ATCC BAA-2537 / CCAP 1431/1 / ULC 316 / JS1) TaxID=1183438 RepID=U5QMW5_GLOK1|nr:2OG-Fe(II) oxygenase [Gloeobacter kilaueensis]AGY59015.1 2OG-Fe(II) oxygenase [Gloeobacter kilaueensis JS1]
METQSLTIDMLCDALIKDERVITDQERQLLASIFQHIKSHETPSAELEAAIAERLAGAVGNVIGQRMARVFGDAVVRRLVDTQMNTQAARVDAQEPGLPGVPMRIHPPDALPGVPMRIHPPDALPGVPMRIHPPDTTSTRKSREPLIGQQTPNGQRSVNSATIRGTQVAVFEEFLSKEELTGLIEFALAHEAHFQASRVLVPGSGTNNLDFSQRRSRVFFDLERYSTLFTQRILSYWPRIAEKLEYTPFEIAEVEPQMTASNDGDFFGKHTDSTHELSRTREITFIYFFHREPVAFTGGELRIYDTSFENGCSGASSFKGIIPQQNQIVFFPGRLVHEILPVHCPSKAFADSRFTINGWLHR